MASKIREPLSDDVSWDEEDNVEVISEVEYDVQDSPDEETFYVSFYKR